MALHLSRVTLYKNDLAFYERATTFTGLEVSPVSSAPLFKTKLDIPLASKNLIVDTLSVRSPGLVIVNYDTELRDSVVANENQENTFRFGSDTFAGFLKSCSGASMSFKRASSKDAEEGKKHRNLTFPK